MSTHMGSQENVLVVEWFHFNTNYKNYDFKLTGLILCMEGIYKLI